MTPGRVLPILRTVTDDVFLAFSSHWLGAQTGEQGIKMMMRIIVMMIWLLIIINNNYVF